MDKTKFDALTRIFGASMTRREALRELVAGAAAVTAGGTLLADQASAASKSKGKNKKKKNRPNQNTEPTPPVNVCAGKNWCIDRTQTCGPANGYGKCLVDSTGGNICAEILFQTNPAQIVKPPAVSTVVAPWLRAVVTSATTAPPATTSSASVTSKASC